MIREQATSRSCRGATASGRKAAAHCIRAGTASELPLPRAGCLLDRDIEQAQETQHLHSFRRSPASPETGREICTTSWAEGQEQQNKTNNIKQQRVCHLPAMQVPWVGRKILVKKMQWTPLVASYWPCGLQIHILKIKLEKLLSTTIFYFCCCWCHQLQS